MIKKVQGSNLYWIRSTHITTFPSSVLPSSSGLVAIGKTDLSYQMASQLTMIMFEGRLLLQDVKS
jgi:hypothetical protein